MPVVIERCTCEHDFQNQMYGNYMRVFNYSLRDSKRFVRRCSVCGTVKASDASFAKEVKAKAKNK